MMLCREHFLIFMAVNIKEVKMSQGSDPKGYWKSSIYIVSGILSIWFFVSFVCGILARDWMDINMPNIGNAKFGFWMAQQGSIICFVLLLVAYMVLMNKLDKKHGYDEEEDS